MRNYLIPAALLLFTATQASAAEHSAAFDAVAAAPASHQVLLEDDKVRVLRVTIAPGATEPIHDHHWPSVMYFEKAQPITYISYEMVDGKPVETARADAPAAALTGAHSSGPEGLHAVHNRGTEPFLALRVEFKDRTAP